MSLIRIESLPYFTSEREILSVIGKGNILGAVGFFHYTEKFGGRKRIFRGANLATRLSIEIIRHKFRVLEGLAIPPSFRERRFSSVHFVVSTQVGGDSFSIQSLLEDNDFIDVEQIRAWGLMDLRFGRALRTGFSPKNDGRASEQAMADATEIFFGTLRSYTPGDSFRMIRCSDLEGLDCIIGTSVCERFSVFDWPQGSKVAFSACIPEYHFSGERVRKKPSILVDFLSLID